MAIVERQTHISRLFLILAAALVATSGRSAQLELYPDPPVIVALRLGPGQTISLDGSLYEAVWDFADPAANFTQSDRRCSRDSAGC